MRLIHRKFARRGRQHVEGLFGTPRFSSTAADGRASGRLAAQSATRRPALGFFLSRLALWPPQSWRSVIEDIGRQRVRADQSEPQWHNHPGLRNALWAEIRPPWPLIMSGRKAAVRPKLAANFSGNMTLGYRVRRLRFIARQTGPKTSTRADPADYEVMEVDA